MSLGRKRKGYKDKIDDGGFEGHHATRSEAMTSHDSGLDMEQMSFDLDTDGLVLHATDVLQSGKLIKKLQGTIKRKIKKENKKKGYQSQRIGTLKEEYLQELEAVKSSLNDLSRILNRVPAFQRPKREVKSLPYRRKQDAETRPTDGRSWSQTAKTAVPSETHAMMDSLKDENERLERRNKEVTEENDRIKRDNEENTTLVRRSEEFERENNRLKGKLSELESENTRLLRNYRQEKAEKDDALTRLSAVASSKIRDNNPNIADLSDVNRPTKIAEKMSELYDNEWTDAFDSLEKSHPDIEVVHRLVTILKNTNERCHGMAWQDFFQHVQTAIELPAGVLQEFKPSTRPGYESVFTKEMQQHIKELRKLRAPTILPIIQKALLSKDADSVELTSYSNKCVEVCWLAAVQDPPLFMNFNPGEKFDTTLFKDYTARGPYVEFLVWPALHLHENGPLLSKGVAQGTRDKIQRSVSQKRDAISRQQSEPNAKTHSSIDANLHQSIRNTATESKRATEL